MALTAVYLIAVVHLALMLAELLPWPRPFILGRVLDKWPKRLELSPNDEEFVAAVVHNAGVYNGIVGVGLLAAAAGNAVATQEALLAGGVVAGVFGGITLSKLTFAQAIAGAIALALVMSAR